MTFGAALNMASASDVRTEVVSSSEKTDLSNMYISSHQYGVTPFERDSMPSDEFLEKERVLGIQFANELKAAGAVIVPLGANELPKLMDDIETAIAAGKSLAEAFQAQMDKHIARHKNKDDIVAVGGDTADLLFVVPETGEVMHSEAKLRSFYALQAEGDGDDAAVKSLGDDFATFLRYRVFGQPDDNADDVNALMAEIRERQSSSNTERFRDIYDATVEHDINYILHLIALRRAQEGLDDTETEQSSEKDEAVDDFIEKIGEHMDNIYKNSKFETNTQEYDESMKVNMAKTDFGK